jgi:hypothetical protein
MTTATKGLQINYHKTHSTYNIKTKEKVLQNINKSKNKNLPELKVQIKYNKCSQGM